MPPANDAVFAPSPYGDPAQLATWLGDVADGDRGAFEQVYRATSAKLFGICNRLINDRAEAEDTLQDVFATVWHKAGQYDASRASAITWLAMIARNKCIDRLRSHAPLRNSAPLEFAGEIVDAAPGGLESAERANENQRLEVCMRELDPDRQRLLRTAFFEGATYEEIASRSDTPLGTVKSWIRRSLLKLKACLER